ncbi:MAG: SRPBCC family protein [Nocardioides sp.]|uniref:SRPBCC family protein n=1 Tax=Nocardioides sp. TaxID=35761 RepID=UPI0039E63A66
MPEQTTSSIVIAADPAAILDVVADFSAYPLWAKGVRSADVVAEFDDGRAEQVRFQLDMPPIRDDYTLQYRWSPEGVAWWLVEGRVLTHMDGAYLLRDLGDGTTEVTYRLALDVAIPLIGLIKRRGEKIIIDSALKGLKGRVEGP